MENEKVNKVDLFQYTFYDNSGKLKFITKKTKFNSMVDALNWIVSYDYKGETVSIF